MKVVITGAADGIGKALAGLYTTNGHTVVGVDFDADRAEQTQAQLGERISFVIADLSDHGNLGSVATSLGNGIDVLIHNAGISEVGYFAQTDMARQQRVMDVNFLAPMVLTRHLLAANALTADGSLVFLSSLSHYVSYPGASVYGATKTGIASYARTLAVTYPERHVLTVYPGPTRTAHARRYSPDNRNETNRMLPETLASHIVTAVNKRQRVLIPGVGNVIFAIAGRLVPRLTNFAMRKTLLEKFEG